MSSSSFMKQQIVFVPDSVFLALGILQTILFVITTITYFLLVYVVWLHSPRRIGNYKCFSYTTFFRYIIINATFGFLFEFFTVGLHMYPILPYPILVLHGLVDFLLLFGKPPQLLIDIIVNCMIACMVGLVYSTMCMFVFRLLQTTQSRYLKVMTNIRVVIASYLINAIIVGVSAFVPLNLQLLTNEQLHAGIREADPLTYEKMKGHIAIGFNTRTSNYYLIAGLSFFIELMFISIVMLLCAFLCYRYLRRNEHLLSRKTVALFRSLINMLMIDLCFAAITGFMTIMTSLFTFAFQVSFGSNIIAVALALADFYPLFTHLLVLIYIEPYKIAVIKFLGLKKCLRIQQAFRWDDTTTSTAQTTVTIFQQQSRRSLPF